MSDTHHAPGVTRFASARLAYGYELALMKAAWARADEQAARRHAVRAHILGQRYLVPHLVSHAWMLRMAWARGDTRDLTGQLRRLLMVLPGWLVGWVPVGNPGLSSVNPLKPFALAEDLAAYFVNDSIWRHVWRRLVLLAIGLLLAFAGPGFIRAACTPW